MQSQDPESFGSFGGMLVSGDLNDDGITDLVIGEPTATSTDGANAGAITLYRGDPVNFWPIPLDWGREPGALMGTAAAIADFNGDGFNEIVYSAPGATAGSAGSERVNAGYLNYRQAGSSPAIISQEDVNGGFNESGDFFGSLLVTGNFDGDAFEDLAVGVPLESSDSGPVKLQSGAVVIFYGEANGLPGSRSQVIDENDGMRGAQHDQEFGSALATGDINGDGFDDLVVGSPQRDDSGLINSGSVSILYGSPTGIAETQGPGTWDFIVGTSHLGRFGEAVAVGDFDFVLSCVLFVPCYADLAIGWPDWDSPTEPGNDHGAIVMFNGSALGITTQSGFLERPDVLPQATWSRSGERFGEVLSVGFWDATIGVDLAIGMPNSRLAQGRLILLPGSDGGLLPTGPLLLDDGLPDSGFSAPRNFGWSVAAGDFNADGTWDLAVSAPTAMVNGVAAGVVEVLYNGCLLCDGFESGDTQAWN